MSSARPPAAARRRAGWALLLAALLGFTASAAVAAGPPAKLAVVEFGMLDTSGEALDQQARHAARLRAMRDQIRAGLAESGAFGLTEPAAGSLTEPAAGATADPDRALASARAAGADYVLLGVVQKMSTLVLWCRASLVDVDSGKIVLDRWLTFRGDTDDAWHRAAAFLTREIEAHPPGS